MTGIFARLFSSRSSYHRKTQPTARKRIFHYPRIFRSGVWFQAGGKSSYSSKTDSGCSRSKQNDHLSVACRSNISHSKPISAVKIEHLKKTTRELINNINMLGLTIIQTIKLINLVEFLKKNQDLLKDPKTAVENTAAYLSSFALRTKPHLHLNNSKFQVNTRFYMPIQLILSRHTLKPENLIKNIAQHLVTVLTEDDNELYNKDSEQFILHLQAILSTHTGKPAKILINESNIAKQVLAENKHNYNHTQDLQQFFRDRNRPDRIKPSQKQIVTHHTQYISNMIITRVNSKQNQLKLNTSKASATKKSQEKPSQLQHVTDQHPPNYNTTFELPPLKKPLINNGTYELPSLKQANHIIPQNITPATVQQDKPTQKHELHILQFTKHYGTFLMREHKINTYPRKQIQLSDTNGITSMNSVNVLNRIQFSLHDNKAATEDNVVYVAMPTTIVKIYERMPNSSVISDKYTESTPDNHIPTIEKYIKNRSKCLTAKKMESNCNNRGLIFKLTFNNTQQTEEFKKKLNKAYTPGKPDNPLTIPINIFIINGKIELMKPDHQPVNLIAKNK